LTNRDFSFLSYVNGKDAAGSWFYMGCKKFYNRYFEGAQYKLHVEGALESPFHRFSTTCFGCGSSRLKIVFEVNDDPEGTSIFLDCQECHKRERLTLNDRRIRRGTSKNVT
jgi:hypothetical protein